MTKEIKVLLSHLLSRAARTIVRELPIIASIIDGINEWFSTFDFRHIRGLSIEDRAVYEQEQIKALKKKIKTSSKEDKS